VAQSRGQSQRTPASGHTMGPGSGYSLTSPENTSSTPFPLWSCTQGCFRIQLQSAMRPGCWLLLFASQFIPAITAPGRLNTGDCLAWASLPSTSHWILSIGDADRRSRWKETKSIPPPLPAPSPQFQYSGPCRLAPNQQPETVIPSPFCQEYNHSCWQQVPWGLNIP
jgi:hypothetical protein